jgi:hypothetical protein
MIRILSIISLIFNLFILGIFTQFSPLLWISSIPAFSQMGLFVFESSPEKAQGFILWLSLKIKIFLLWIWGGIIDFIKLVIKTVLGEIENNPINSPGETPINPDKDNYGDIDNKEYFKWLKNKLDEYKYHIIVSSIIVIGGTIIYLYWDSICCSWRRDGPRDEPRDDFVPLPTNPEIHGPSEGTIPSPDSSSSGNSYERLFRSPITDRISKFKSKVSSFIKGKSVTRDTIVNIPRGIYRENGQNMYNGLPLPRTEILNGTQYYIRKDNHGFINIMNDSYSGVGEMEIINPFTGRGINRVHISINDRMAFINTARDNTIFEAPLNSYVRNPMFDGIEMTHPSLSNMPVASTSNLPNLNTVASTSNLPDFDPDAGILSDIDLTPKAKPITLDTKDMFDLENPFT